MDGVRFTLPAGILRQDFEIIDEQENHVVLTVRVPIDLIRDNHSLLTSLSEIAIEKPIAPPDPPKRRAHWIYAALIAIGFLLPSPFFTTGFAHHFNCKAVDTP